MLKRIRIPMVSVLCLLPLWALAGVPSGLADLLRADFDDKTIGLPIGSGGAAVGEPIQITGLGTEIIDCTPVPPPSGSVDNCLFVTNDLSSTNARPITWQLLNNAEISTGTVSISFDFTPTARDGYVFQVRESGGAAQAFLTLSLTASGSFVARDSAGLFPTNSFTYSANQLLQMRFDFDMDARTSQVSINDTVLFTGRAHGVVERGVGRLNTGYSTGSSGNPFRLNNLVVQTLQALPIILDADFDNQPVGQPLGTGGASVNQPISIGPGIATQVTSAGAGNRALTMSLPNAPSSASSIRWSFLDSIEVLPGVVAIEADVQFSNLNRYQFLVREAATSASNYTSLLFASTGELVVTDGSGVTFIAGVSYQAGVRYRLRLTFDQTTGLYSAFLNDDVLFIDRAHGVATGRGIGAVLISFPSNANAGASLIVDDLQVGASAAPNIVSELAVLQQPTTGTVGQALAPTLEIGAMNVFDEVVTDGAMVMIDVANGPAGAVLSQSAAMTLTGMASFPNLSANPAGTYQLRARADRAQITTSLLITISPRPSSVFSNGFEPPTN